jgi:carbamoyl-phosphate synthase large subunit
MAAKVMAGRTLAELGLTQDLEVAGVFVKSPMFPFVRFPGVDTILGPEMKSTGEVMGGSSTSFGVAFAKAQLSVGQRLPEHGTAFVSVNNTDKANLTPIARDLAELGFRLIATRGTAAYLRAYGLEVDVVYKVNEGRPNIADEIVNRKVDLVINTPLGRESFFDDRTVRRAAMMQEVPCITTLTGAAAAVQAIRGLRQEGLGVRRNCCSESLGSAKFLQSQHLSSRRHEDHEALCSKRVRGLRVFVRTGASSFACCWNCASCRRCPRNRSARWIRAWLDRSRDSPRVR